LKRNSSVTLTWVQKPFIGNLGTPFRAQIVAEWPRQRKYGTPSRQLTAKPVRLRCVLPQQRENMEKIDATVPDYSGCSDVLSAKI
jgi:hypothetical protein